MVTRPSVTAVTLEGEYCDARFRDPGDVSDVRTPDWARGAAADVASESKVGVGTVRDGDDWRVQSALLRTSTGKATASRQAERNLGTREP